LILKNYFYIFSEKKLSAKTQVSDARAVFTKTDNNKINFLNMAYNIAHGCGISK